MRAPISLISDKHITYIRRLPPIVPFLPNVIVVSAIARYALIAFPILGAAKTSLVARREIDLILVNITQFGEQNKQAKYRYVKKKKKYVNG